MSDFHIRVGYLLPELEVTLYHDRDVADLTNATGVELRYRLKSGGAVTVKNAAFVGARTGGKVKYAWVTGDTDTVAVYEANWRVTYQGGKTENFPSDEFFTIKVAADL